ncbi:MAG: CARDB domain-containing protein [Xanthomonadales bacterium]|nr:CARDB domain-containing protein [Xanthomonadales bacterium]
MTDVFRMARMGICMALFALSMGAQAQTTHTVTVGNNFFSPSQLTIQVGDTVRWVNPADGGPVHNVTGDTFNSMTAEAFTFEVTFNQAGVESYLCTIHPSMQGSITIEGGGGGQVDLSMSEVGVNNNITYQAGGPITIDAEVDNVGSAGSAAYAVDFYASTDANITSGDTLLGTANRPALGAGNSDNFSANLTLPQSIAPGSYFIGAIIDVNDANNGNNSNFEDEPIQVQGAPAADLALQSVNAPNGAFEQGSVITIQSTTTNVGSLMSDAYTITFYASDNNIISESDTPIGSANRSGLAAGASDTTPFMATIPPDLPPGSYFIGAILSIVDSNSSNNVAFDGTAIQVTESGAIQFVINNGLNDAWFNILTAGQGFFITVFPDIGAIFLAWFTYDTERPDPSVLAILGEPGHRWLTAFGNYEGNIASLNIELTEGGVFNSAEPGPVQDPNYGTIEIEFIDCNNAIVRYNIPSLGLMGEIPITRIAGDNIPACLAAQPQ